MDYQTFVSQEFIPRIQAILNGLSSNLKIAGIQANSITITEVVSDTVQDLRWRIEAHRGNRTIIAYLELTSSGIVNGQMGLVITLWVEGNGNQITVNSYTAGVPVAYNDPAAIDALLQKLSTLEGVSTGELLTNIRAFLGV